eukprot:13752312-Alexandrium_andersonii.AAC.1
MRNCTADHPCAARTIHIAYLRHHPKHGAPETCSAELDPDYECNDNRETTQKGADSCRKLQTTKSCSLLKMCAVSSPPL